MPDGVNAVYYIDSLQFTIDRADIDGVTLTTAKDAAEIYQNHDLQCTAAVSGTGVLSQKVIYSIEPSVEGASISSDGLLSVKNAAPGVEIHIKAASVEDPSKYDSKTVTVLAQEIRSVSVSAEGSPDTIYQGNSLQLKADVTAAGDPDTAVTWSLAQTLKGVSLSKDGLLTAGKDAAEGTVTVKATSVFDKTKSGTYTVSVKANKISEVRVQSAGDQQTIEPGTSMNLSALVDNAGTTATKDVTWSMEPKNANGLSIKTNGNVCTLSADSTAADGTTVTIQAVSVFDTSKQGKITITVKAVEEETFDFNKLSVEYFENFDGEGITLDSVKEDGVLSWKVTEPTDLEFCPGFDERNINIYQRNGIHKTDPTLSTRQRASNALKSFLGSDNDYIQLTLNNTTNKEKKYTFSFLFRFYDIDADTEYIESQMETDTSYVKYELPLKMVSVNSSGEETIIKDNLNIPFRCNMYPSTNPEYYEITSSIVIPANQTIRLRLMLNGDLPTCLSPDHTAENAAYATTPHPCTFNIDNIAISSGNLPVLSMKAGETQSLDLHTLEGDTVKYYTNSYLAKYTHGESETCHRFDTTVATVDDKGVVTANTAGETACIAEITHANGEVERKQCIIRVEE